MAPVWRECLDNNGDQVHVASRCRLSGIEFELLGSVKENLLKSLSFPNVTWLLGASFVHDTADGIDSNGHKSSSLMNPEFVCERWIDASEYGVAAGRDT